MSTNNGGNKVYVLYKVSNSKCDSGHNGSGHYNAFTISRSASGAVTLAEVKRQCLALKSLHDFGPNGFHWRVRVDDQRQQQQQQKPNVSSYTWWDIIDENSRLPVKESVPLSELEQMFAQHGHQHKHSGIHSSSGTATTSAAGSGLVRTGVVAGAVRKAFQNVASTVEEVVNISSTSNSNSASDIDFNEPRVSFIVFKLLDMIKLQNEYNTTHTTPPATTAAAKRTINNTSKINSRAATDLPTTPAAPSRPVNAAPLPTAQRRVAPDMRASTATATSSSTPVRTQQPVSQSMPGARPTVAQRGVPAPRSTSNGNSAGTNTGRKATQPSRTAVHPTPTRTTINTTTTSTKTPAPPARSSSEELLMDFGPTTTASSATSFHRSYSVNTPSFSHETKEEKLKREYAEKAQQQNRVWDPVDERWIVVENNDKVGGASESTATNNNNNNAKIKGISLDDASNAAGKSVHVQSAVQQRVSEMKMAQEKAKEELKLRKEMAASLEQEEDLVRVKLDPKIKQWSEEHGQKKQLAALLASLHVVLWPEAQWKPVNLGDLLEEKKLRSCYKRASLKVHPDKTKDLNAEQRFLAKRIFDALTQAMTVYEDSKRS